MPWHNHATFGIDQRPMLLSLENYRSGLVWDTAGRNAHIRQAVCSLWRCIYLPLVVRDSGPGSDTLDRGQLRH